MTYSKICFVCGKEYGTIWKQSKYCSDECRIASSREYNRKFCGYKRQEKKCKRCGKNFITYRKNQKFCDKECTSLWHEENDSRERVSRKRFEILVRDKFVCQYCGRSPIKHGVVLHVDHIIPKSKGGDSTIDNLITACEDCNTGKKSRHYGEIFTYIKNKDF